MVMHMYNSLIILCTTLHVYVLVTCRGVNSCPGKDLRDQTGHKGHFQGRDSSPPRHETHRALLPADEGTKCQHTWSAKSARTELWLPLRVLSWTIYHIATSHHIQQHLLDTQVILWNTWAEWIDPDKSPNILIFVFSLLDS